MKKTWGFKNMGIYKYDIIISKIIIVFVIEINIYVKYYLYRRQNYS